MVGEGGMNLKKILVILPGGADDQSWCSSAMEGLSHADTMGFSVLVREHCPGGILENELLKNGPFHLVIGHGCEYVQEICKLAPSYLTTKFFVSCDKPNDAPPLTNVIFLRHHQYEGLFLVGRLAALMSKTGKVGFVGGAYMQIQRDNMAAFRAGALSGGKKVEVFSELTGTFEDPKAGRQLAKQYINQGADVLAHTADSTGHGIFEVAKEHDTLVIGFPKDQRENAPNLVITSLLVEMPKVINQALQESLVPERDFSGVWVIELASGNLGFTPFSSKVPQKVADEIKRLREDIVKGDLDVKSICTQY